MEEIEYRPRISVAVEYAQKLGQAIYNFTYLEWAVIWSVEKLSPGFLNEHSTLTAGQIAQRFLSAIRDCDDLQNQLSSDLVAIAERFQVLTGARNDLLHAHPYTARGGEQRLHRRAKQRSVDWTEGEIDRLAEAFERCAIDLNRIFHDHLNKRKILCGSSSRK